MTTSPYSKELVVKSDWYRSLNKYEKPDIKKAVGQLCNTILPYIALWLLMIKMVHSGMSYWLVLPLQILAAGLVVRIFIFQHDSGHGSFFPSHTANRILGILCGLITFTPYEEWRQSHAEHHVTSGDLERRGTGDIITMTVNEYNNAPFWSRFGYRLYRNPLVLFIIGPPIQFVLLQRIVHKNKNPKQKKSIIVTNVALVIITLLMCWAIGWQAYLLIQGPIIAFASIIGVWMFYVQHQYDDVYWEHHEQWDPIRAAIEGSSYFKLPPVLQWFTGNIGLHHIHHLRPRIANYHLQKCYDEVKELQVEKPMTLAVSFECLTLTLWDESERRLVSFRALKSQSRARPKRAKALPGE